MHDLGAITQISISQAIYAPHHPALQGDPLLAIASLSDCEPHMELKSPISPSSASDTHDPHVFGVVEHGLRFSSVQLGANEQLTALSTALDSTMACLPELSVTPPETADSTKLKASSAVFLGLGKTCTVAVAELLAPMTSNICAYTDNSPESSAEGNMADPNYASDFACSTDKPPDRDLVPN
jgi:hypothetical protein